MNNRKTGNRFEAELCNYLFHKGFWVHNFAQNQAGQPADVIAVKNRKAYLIDCKVCEHDRFPFSRIEENQHTSMAFWKSCGNGYGQFALRLTDGSVYIIDHELMVALSSKQASINGELIKHYGMPIESWVKKCE